MLSGSKRVVVFHEKQLLVSATSPLRRAAMESHKLYSHCSDISKQNVSFYTESLAFYFGSTNSRMYSDWLRKATESVGDAQFHWSEATAAQPLFSRQLCTGEIPFTRDHSILRWKTATHRDHLHLSIQTPLSQTDEAVKWVSTSSSSNNRITRTRV